MVICSILQTAKGGIMPEADVKKEEKTETKPSENAEEKGTESTEEAPAKEEPKEEGTSEEGTSEEAAEETMSSEEQADMVDNVIDIATSTVNPWAGVVLAIAFLLTSKWAWKFYSARLKAKSED
tara:strand:+ start:436 stop:807 length:372 start_codon:yes stop_codon:yes gene_type:complete